MLSARAEILTAHSSVAESDSAEALSTPHTAAPSDQPFSIGIAGYVRLGVWTEVRCWANDLPSKGEMVIQAVDGDGIPVDYHWPWSQLREDKHAKAIGYFRLGQLNHRVKIQILDESQSVVRESILDFENNDSLKLLPATRMLWLELGSDIGVNSTTSSYQRLTEGGLTLIRNANLADLPQTDRGWEGLNRLIANVDGSNWPQDLSSSSKVALRNWLAGGGRISMVVRSDSIEDLRTDGALGLWTDGIAAEKHSTRKSSSIEFFVGSRTQLLNEQTPALDFVTFPDSPAAELEIDSKPTIARYAVGLGQVDYLGLDLAGTTLGNWPSRNNLTAKWLQIEKPSDARLNSLYGYSDLTGQLRSELDQFKRVTLISFTTVAGILLAFLAMVAADYFLMRHVIKRMELTWVTLPIYCLLTCGAVAWLFASSKSPEILANQAEVIDIDSIQSTVQTKFWAHVYSPVAQNMDVRVSSSNTMQLPVTESLVGWNGLAGSGMGGMMSTKLAIGSDRPYQIVAKQSEDNTSLASQVEILRMPFDVASTRSLRGSWQGKLTNSIESKLTKVPGRDRLYGTFTNPFPVELKNCFLINGGWAYQFRETLPPGTSIDVGTQTEHIALSVWLTRRRATSEKSSTNQPWDPVGQDLHRVLEMLMFYELGNGQDYTNLLNNYETSLDLSQLTRLDRAIFLGRSDRPVTTLQVDGKDLREDQFDQAATAVRVVLPVGIRDK